MNGTIGNAEKIADLDTLVGRFFGHIEFVTCRDVSISKPRVRPNASFAPDTRVEFSLTLREMFPIGTRFMATVKVCQKHVDGMAKVPKGSINRLGYDYIWTTKD
ncbi:hypothetical protein [Rhizobium laguerreae]|uniref:hypothetical protein n=1 Tax=Rhizobium laguerreae TaxID=1076926 RepID=UPI001C9192DC|nr:hypothetical protein [Rhizobium laguerreae]MBY3383069.1 hypothetical protein [Rhizobium laguerreae]